MAKRHSGDGTYRQRSNGLWEARLYVNGRRRSVYGKTLRECRERFRSARRDAERGVTPAPINVTVGSFLDDWVAGTVTRLRPSTAESYRTVIRLYVKPAIGHVPLSRLEAGHVSRMIAELSVRQSATGRPLSSTTVRYAYAVLRIALGRALKQGKIAHNVATLVDAPRKARFEPRPLTVEQVRVFLKSISGDRLEALYVAALGLGMRQGELLALQWEDVDLDRASVTVRHTLERRTYRLAPTKTERARRTLRIPATVIGALRAHRARQLTERLAAGSKWQEQPDLVFRASTGRALDTRNVTQYFQDALRSAGLPHQRFHDTRHAWATLQLQGGEELGVVSKMLGHANVSTTADVYAHLTSAMQERATERMDAILSSQAAV